MTELVATLGGWLAVLPLAVPLGASGLALFFLRAPLLARALALLALGVTAVLTVALAAATQTQGLVLVPMGDWPLPMGIAFAADATGALFAATATGVSLLVAVFALGDVPRRMEERGFWTLYLAITAGVNAAFLTGDIFNLYVWFEVILISSFGLLVLGGAKEQLDGAVKYAVLNLLATTLFLFATGLLYGMTGTLNMADLAGAVAAVENRGAVAAVAFLYLLAFGMKAAIFPLYFWLPAAYHTPMPAVQALFAGLLTKVGVYALIRVFTLIFDPDGTLVTPVLMTAALVTMMLGAMGAFVQSDLSRMLGFLVVSGIGTMLTGLALGTEAGLQGAVLYAAHSMAATAALFLVAGLVWRRTGTTALEALSGLYAKSPLLATLFLLCGLSLAGIPPLLGFWPKLLLVQAALAAGHVPAATVLLVSSFVVTAALGRVWAVSFLRGDEIAGAPVPGGARALRLAPVLALAAGLLAAGLWPQPLLSLSGAAGSALAAPETYVRQALPLAETQP